MPWFRGHVTCSYVITQRVVDKSCGLLNIHKPCYVHTNKLILALVYVQAQVHTRAVPW